ncbi:hypothetical protein [Breznakia pachnodae]|uniref:Uncharacterized protein n=1 Tax=Breznakia pachnodae TaxID=265178 RepID=A0ABU0E870_9FIRM|nr:hypothetical protein [Breznakia pachnodae]MDQ0363104.1 hypothetical protein [Breznakia pachnodae]
MKNYQTSEFIEICRNATIELFKDKITSDDIQTLLDCMPMVNNNELLIPESSFSIPKVINSEVLITSSLGWSIIRVTPSDTQYQTWRMDERVWGTRIGSGVASGFIYTVYESYEAFFKYTTTYQLKSVNKYDDILQINWFNSSGLPIAQFNGVLEGGPILEIGGGCYWKNSGA